MYRPTNAGQCAKSSIQPAVSSKELNADIRAGKLQDFDPAPPPTKAAVTPGGPGSSWRMMRLRRVYETAEEEGLPIEQVALERFGSLEAFEEAKEERQALDLRDGGRSNQSQERGRPSSSRNDGERGFMFNDAPGSAASSRSSSYRKPTGRNESRPSTPSPSIRPPPNRRLDSLRLPSQANSPLQQSHTPIPTVMTPSAAALPRRALSPSSLNKLQAKVLRAKLMGSPDADKLEQEYEAAARAGSGNLDDSDAPVRTRVEVLPTLDGQGRLYDVGHGRDDGVAAAGAGNRKKKEKVIHVVALYIFLFTHFWLSSRLGIPKLGSCCGTTRTTTKLRLEKCCDRRSSVVEWQTRRIWMLNLHRPLWVTGSLLYVFTMTYSSPTRLTSSSE